MIAALFAALGVTLVLPFVPAVHEAYRRRDASPLAVSDRYREDRRLGPSADARVTPGEATSAHSAAPDVAVRDDFAGPPGFDVDRLRVRTIARLGAGSIVRERLVVGDSADIGPGSHLYGSAEAGDVLWLGAGCRFERLHARAVCTGAPGTVPPLAPVAPAPFELPTDADMSAGRALIHGDLAIPDGASYDGDLVVLGSLTIGNGASVTGAVKSRGDLTMGVGARVGKNALSEGDLRLATGAHVAGAAVANGTLSLAEGVRIGTPDAPTTATGGTVELAADVTVYGTIWAREHGAVA